MDLERLTSALAPREIVGRAPAPIRDLAYDARRATPGSLFFCVPGERADGHDFAPEAVANGAVALVVERPLELPVPQLVVDDARAAMAVGADEFFGRPTEQLTVAAVTGTSGKTTVSFLLAAILEEAGLRPGLIGTIETWIGGERRKASRTTPEAIDLQRAFRAMLDEGNRSCTLEATSHGSQLKRLDRVRFACLVFTNLSQDHLDLHGTMEEYFQAKRRLFIETRPPAAINVGDPWGRRLAADRPDALTFGLTGEARVGVEALDGIALKLRGRFNVENALGAMAGARLLGVDEGAIARGLESVAGVPGRFERVDEGQPFEVIVDYSHKPGALDNVLRTARELTTGRLICVFGCGGDRDREKRPLMGRIAAELSDLAIVTSDNPRSEEPQAIIAEILAGAEGQLEVEPDRRAAIAQAVAAARAGDVVLIAGKGHEQGQEFADRTLPFDDREVAREALRRLGGARVIALPLDGVRSIPGRLDVAPWAGEVTGVQIDSRRIEEGDLFVAVGDGAAFVKHAFARGAAATLVPDDAFAALASLASVVRSRSAARVVGITGSTGKTSTKDILAALCRPHVPTVAAEEGFNNELGLPLTLLRTEPDTEVVIAEMGMRGLGQIRALAEVARPDVGVVTGVGPVHLELLGTVERVAQAKAELLGCLPQGGVAIVPADPLLAPHIPDGLDVRTFGRGGESSVTAFELRDGRAHVTFDLRGREVEVAFSFTARHQAENALAALLALDALGLPLPAEPVPVALSRWRGEEHQLPGGGLLINDAYNANPVSMRAALRHLADRAGGRRTVAVLGDMAELGPDAPLYHAEVGGAVAESGVDLLLTVGPLAHGYAGAASGVESRTFATVEEAAAALPALVRPGDCVLVKASRALGLEALADTLTSTAV